VCAGSGAVQLVEGSGFADVLHRCTYRGGGKGWEGGVGWGAAPAQDSQPLPPNGQSLLPAYLLSRRQACLTPTQTPPPPLPPACSPRGDDLDTRLLRAMVVKGILEQITTSQVRLCGMAGGCGIPLAAAPGRGTL